MIFSCVFIIFCFSYYLGEKWYFGGDASKIGLGRGLGLGLEDNAEWC
tara:strand:- start:3728 stop:3868 length:141 start_codon:yes stop_codon:yes gene_type:complete